MKTELATAVPPARLRRGDESFWNLLEISGAARWTRSIISKKNEFASIFLDMPGGGRCGDAGVSGATRLLDVVEQVPELGLLRA